MKTEVGTVNRGRSFLLSAAMERSTASLICPNVRLDVESCLEDGLISR